MRSPDDQGGWAPPPGREGEARPDERELDSAAGIGPRVSAVFTAAEQAAEHMIQMARAEVDDLRTEAESEVRAFRIQRRQEAEQEARALLDAARAEAEAIRAEAIRAAEAVDDAARRREQWIDEGIRLMVERAEWARRGLGEVITRLDEFVVHPPEEWPETPPLPAEPAFEPPPAARMAGQPHAPEREPEPQPVAGVQAEPPPDVEPEPNAESAGAQAEQPSSGGPWEPEPAEEPAAEPVHDAAPAEEPASEPAGTVAAAEPGAEAGDPPPGGEPEPASPTPAEAQPEPDAEMDVPPGSGEGGMERRGWLRRRE